MRSSPVEIWKFRHLIRRLILSDLRTGVARRKLGVVWWLLDPILLLGVYWGVVVGILGAGRKADGPYPLFLFSGLLLWKWLSSSLSRSSTVYVGRAGLLKSVAVPLAALPIATAFAGFIPWSIGAILLFTVSGFVGQDVASLRVLQSVPLLLLSVGIITSISIFVAVTTVYFRDLCGLLPHVLRAGYYLSPGLWSMEMLRDRVSNQLFSIYKILNPLALPMDSWRRITFTGELISLDSWIIMTVHMLAFAGISSALIWRYESDVVRRL